MSESTIVLNQINLAKENNQNAFSFLLNLYWDDVYKFQLKRTNNEIDAEDITIVSFAKAFEKINTYNHKYIFKGHYSNSNNNSCVFDKISSAFFHNYNMS